MSKCLFCHRAHSTVAETNLSFAFRDTFPVTKGHTLVIPKRHVVTIWELTQDEYTDIFSLVREVKDLIQKQFIGASDADNVKCRIESQE